MKTLAFYFDPISPFAWLAFQRLPVALMGSSYRVLYKPVLFAAMLKANGQLGPAEIPSKRDWTYLHVLWLGHHLGIPLSMPASHPFNPLPLLRLSLATAMADEPGACNRYVAEQVLRHVWAAEGDPLDVSRLQKLQSALADHMNRRGLTLADPDGDAVRQQLRANTEEALAAGAFGVPSFAVDGRLFWGLDSLPMLKAYLDGDDWFDGKDWTFAKDVPVGIVRPR